MFHTKRYDSAFTLVELIVVIVILAILATIAFLSFSSQSWSARDSTRLSDISSIKKSVEMYNVNAWTYPTPDYAYSYTYSWGIIWNQWTIWDSAYKMLQKNLSKKVVDPLKWSEYDYSLASNKREYQVAWNFENPTSFERSFNPFDSSLLNPKLSALGWTGANVYISWNYNWVMLKVFTWSTYYFVPTPTLFWIWTWSTVYDNTFWSWKDLLPWINNVAIFDSSKVYATWSDNLWTTDITSLMTTIKAAYSTWNVTTPAVQAIVSASWAELINLWEGLVRNNLWGGVSSGWNYGWGWSSWPDANTVLLLHFDWDLLNSWTNTWTIANINNVTTTWPGKFGNAAYFNWSSTSLTIPSSNDFNFGSGNFTIDTWVYPFDNWSVADPVLHSNNTSNYLWFYSDYDGTPMTTTDTWAASWLKWPSAIPLSQWTHYAVVKNWTNLKIYINWVMKAERNDFNKSNFTSDGFVVWAELWWNHFKWYIDEMRISKWIARWTENFTPPTSAY